MKKFFTLLLIGMAVFSCQKDPDTEKLDADFVVLTNHDTSFDFTKVNTYFVPDSVLVIGRNSDKPNYWVNENAEKILNTFRENLDKRGFVEVTDKSQADLGLQVSFVEDTSYFVDYQGGYGNPWWGSYPGYWSPGYWGSYWGGGYYYPYPIMYSYNVGALMGELVNLTAPTTSDATTKLPVVWNSYMAGLLYNSKFNTAASIQSINQAFQQSPYLKTSAQK